MASGPYKKGKDVHDKSLKIEQPRQKYHLQLQLVLVLFWQERQAPGVQWFEQKKSISDNSQGSGTNQRANQLLADRKQVFQNHVTFQLKKKLQLSK